MTSSSVVYVDTSALGALLIDQPESPALLDWLDQTPATLISSDLLETELRRVAVREGLEQSDVTRVLDGVALAALSAATRSSHDPYGARLFLMHPVEFIAGLPKAELHVHHVGSASPHIVSQLAQRHPGTVPADLDELRRYFRFTDFAHFVEVYLSVVDLLKSAEDIRLLTYEVARDMAAQNIRYAELTCTPYTSEVRGIPAEAFVEAIEDARVAAERDLGIQLRWIFDIPGETGIPGAEGTTAIALDHGPSSLIGFGLGGPEIGVPRPQFKPYFDRARAAGLHSLPHAGETTGPQTVWDALNDLGAERIGHGTSAAQDQELLDHLAASGIPLEVCPTSNVATGAVPDLDHHPIRAMVEAGAHVTLNSDDPPMFATDLNQEYAVAARLLDLDQAGIAELARQTVRATFLDQPSKKALLDEIDVYEGGWVAG